MANALSGILAALMLTAPAAAQESAKVDAYGTIRGGEISVPMSSFLSGEAKAQLTARVVSLGP